MSVSGVRLRDGMITTVLTVRANDRVLLLPRDILITSLVGACWGRRGVMHPKIEAKPQPTILPKETMMQ